jgi:superfamily II DNA or RNA helicase
MSLVSNLASYINSKVRKRGAHYFHGRRVRVTACGPEVAQAVVTGSSLYEISLIREGTVLRATCSCPFSERGEVCKHVWAVLMAVDARGGLRGNDGTLPQRLVAEAAADELDPEDEDPDLEDFQDEGFEDEEFPEEDWELPAPVPAARPTATVRAPSVPTWRETIQRLAGAGRPAEPPKVGPDTEILYVLDLPRSLASQELTLELSTRRRKRDGSWGKLQRLSLRREELPRLPDSADRKVLSLLGEARSGYAWPGGYFSSYSNQISPHREIPAEASGILLPMLCGTGRFLLRRTAESGDLEPLAWDDGEAWALWLEAREVEDGGCVLSASLRRGEERFASREQIFLLASGFLIAGGRISRLASGTALRWAPLLNHQAALRVPSGDRDEMVARLLAAPDLPPLDLPETMRVEETRAVPRPRLRLLSPPKHQYTYRGWPSAVLSFLYDAHEVPADAAARGFYEKEERRFLLRDFEAERRSAARLGDLGFRTARDGYSEEPALRIAPTRVPKVVRTLLAEGWSVEAEGKLYRSASQFKMGVSSGVDWFELHGEVEFEGQTVPLPELLAALRRGERFITLGDGSLGILPEEWLKKIAPIARLGEVEGDHLRFQSAQAALLDAWLAEEPEATFDEAFVRARERLHSFAGIAPLGEPPGFSGELRAYQKAGLGWLHYLRDFGFGGCLADDMGLGKTIQVLALLEARRTLRAAEGLPPSLIVVPRSLVFNWLAEAARFTPELRVLDHTGTGRTKRKDPFTGCDLVLTTYGTLRRDVSALRQTEFDYLILDEAQAIKNADSQTAKAARLLRGRHRLALTGTPIENHLGELWSLLEFLNPGILGVSPLFAAEELRNPDPETCERLARGLRPFLLRRTKEQVAPELPPKVEQTLFCELPPKQRQLYDELRDHYRAALGARIGEQGLGRAKILVLEALLRLRQAACHPGLLDQKRAGEPCAKLDLLLPQLQEILAEGHKVLVFSQFTSFLALLRAQLEAERLPYLYLDGATRDRRERVEAFQSDPKIRLFLISLRAGGLGLNLTAADYVYLLDPWWNPAVESQAIDRTHRIGQTRPVFACRIVARGTVEEKILELQKTKRDLADAVIQADQSLLAGLTREDLELLLS